eukprot:c27425_g1_i1 orf=361-1917(+)
MAGGMKKEMEKRRRAAVVVLGDLGRSPRMQYHALSLADQAGLEVDVIAYAGNEPHSALIDHSRIHLHLMRLPLPEGLPRALYLLIMPAKIIIQIITLFWILCIRIDSPDLFLVQNPPSIPTLTIVRWACQLRKSAFIIDWHNFGYTILGLSLGSSHLFVKLYFWYEKRYGRMADGHLCVTEAMQHELAQNWGIRATVLYDRSPAFFHASSLEQKHELFCRLQQDISKPMAIQDCCSIQPDDGHKNVQGLKYTSSECIKSESLHDALSESELTLFTGRLIISRKNPSSKEICNDSGIWLREDRPALIVSSTSWTVDEDFGMLLEAAVCYDCRVEAILGEYQTSSGDTILYEKGRSLFPRLLIIVTGKGPMREKYEKHMQKLQLRHVAFRTMWVSAKDYPILLGSADLGVCLHCSSSGLDLPMKVVDMFGCGLPVCAVSYSCIDELVKNHVNGLLFSSSSELADQFLDLFKGFPEHCALLNKLKHGVLASGSSAQWSNEWEKHALPLILEVCNKVQSLAK